MLILYWIAIANYIECSAGLIKIESKIDDKLSVNVYNIHVVEWNHVWRCSLMITYLYSLDTCMVHWYHVF